MVSTLRAVWRRLPIPYAMRARISPLYGMALNLFTRLWRSPALPPERIAPGPLIVSAYVNEVTGIGRAGRMTIAKLGEWGVPIAVHDIRGDPSAASLRGLPKGGVWVCHCNPPEVLEMIVRGTDKLWASRYRIGFWAYELEDLPSDWQSMIPYFHEIWTPSRFVADAVQRSPKARRVAVRVMPHPLPDVAGVTPNRSLLGFADRFVFLSMFDGRSSFARKNPGGTLTAFQRAFSANDASAALVIKVVAPDADPAALALLRQQAEGWPNIRFLTEHLSDREAIQVIASADCLVSLHRSEGFGLTIAEAMALGTPVIATGWSGNVDFSSGGVVEIGYRLVPTTDNSGRYAKRGARWADPDLGAAADAMRALVSDPAQCRALSERGRTLVAERLGGPYPDAPYRRFLAASRAVS